ncbi:hypothetical protein [Paenibacillus polymyxa]|uniref:hypothetical protein n=1 Tax=Paenibacillus polymyxa TaxID=1406 RepID=UPI0007E98315|nr:hypothetical protein [Paenibacillus polymyxa]OAZ43372.1 hypothetical protein A9Z39_22295 [Paenibacillus polymyxa]
MSRVIADDEQYEKARKAVLDLAYKLDDPLIDMPVSERKRTIKIYDRTTDLILLYSRGRNVQERPELAAEYKALGWAYQDFTNPAPTNTPTEPEQAPETPPEPPKAVPNLSGWLD